MFGLTSRGRHHEPPKAALGPAIVFSYAPFVLTFLAAFAFAWRNLFPLLSGQTASVANGTGHGRKHAFRFYQIPSILRSWTSVLFEHAPAITFSTTIALSAVLAELIFCEIVNIVNPVARATALEITISILLISLVIVTPALEIHSITSAAGWKLSGLGRGARAIAWMLDILGLVAWLAAFWWVGRAVLGSNHPYPTKLNTKTSKNEHGFGEESLERIGIIGISLMASLAGFAAVSSLWQTFGVRQKKVKETDIIRKQSGLDATSELVSAKEIRLRSLERDVQSRDQSFMTRMVGTIKGSSETYELQSLRVELKGLEAMQSTLSNSLRSLRARRDAQLQAQTPLGRIFIIISYVFSLYCLYRIAATSVATLRRWWHPSPSSFSTSDPINNVLALVAKHWDPDLDRVAWSRQISFLLSGLMLLASFNAVLQTVLLFSRFTPSRLLQSAQQNLALLVSQISATYVVSSALLLRSNLPREMSGVIESALGAPLDTAFAERWFEGWFLGACLVTTIGIWLGKSVVGAGSWEEDADEIDVEMGKRS